MMSNNKILTVSYGTFSCTLEGFDDSFGTMKAIAEYFRDLASEDRYFGAEPPQPDTEMLQRIAEREISRRVQAREHEGNIFLSASGPEAAAETVSDAPAVDQPADNAAKLIKAEADRAADAARAADAETARVQAAAAEKAKAEDEAEDTGDFDDDILLEDEVIVVESTTTEAADGEPQQSAPEDEDDIDLTAVMAHAQTTDAQLMPRDLAAELPEANAFFGGTDTDDTSETDDVESATEVEVEDIAPEHPAKRESIADKLERIRAVVSQADADSDDDDGYLEDEHAEAPQSAETEAEDVTADALADIEAALAADDVAAAPAEVSLDDDDEDDDVASILASLSAYDDDGSDADDADNASDDAANLFEDSQDAAEAEPEEAAPQPRRIARVIKVKRADLEAAIEQGDLEEVGDTASTLSADDEADLARELASLEAEIAPQEDAETPAVGALPAIDENGDADVSRLMAEADQQMDEEDGAQRRDAFAHLRAAVAAKKADTNLGKVDPEKEEGAYRQDLATAVKPRRPVANGGRSERPEIDQRPAPLKLVAEQRVDTPSAAPSGPVRPRRVAAVQDTTPEDAKSTDFAEFAEDLGAHNLSDLLEAAAAYMSFVEGREQFTRPQLMNKVRQVEQDDFSREDGLRSFGQLLRAGKIEKLKSGRFTVTPDIGFRPDARAAG